MAFLTQDKGEVVPWAPRCSPFPFKNPPPKSKGALPTDTCRLTPHPLQRFPNQTATGKFNDIPKGKLLLPVPSAYTRAFLPSTPPSSWEGKQRVLLPGGPR